MATYCVTPECWLCPFLVPGLCHFVDWSLGFAYAVVICSDLCKQNMREQCAAQSGANLKRKNMREKCAAQSGAAPNETKHKRGYVFIYVFVTVSCFVQTSGNICFSL